MKFLIIGGDAAGMSAASRAKRLDPSVHVTVLEQTFDVSYSACGMPYNIADAQRSMEELIVRKAEVFRAKQQIDVRLGHRAESLDPKAHTVSGRTLQGNPFTFDYDRLLIATGASPIRPDVPGFDLDGVMCLKSLEQGRKIKNHISGRGVCRAVIVGMGYIAMEMAEALRARDLEVAMVKPRPTLLPWMAPELSSTVKETLQANGVKLYPGYDIERIERNGQCLKVVCGQDLALDADLVLVAVGVAPNSRLAEEAGLDLSVNKSIAVDKRLQTSAKDIYAAGDCADAFNVVSGRRTWVPLALRANRAGWAVADNVCGKASELAGIAGTAVFKVFDLQVARTGLTFEEAEKSGFRPVSVTIATRSKAHGQPGSNTIKVHMLGDRKTGRLLGAQMVGKEGVAHRINAAAVALHAGMSVADFFQSDLAYAPPFGPVWDPLLTAANQLLKKI